MNIVISGQQPPVCFLHCEKLRSQTRRKDLPLAFFFFFRKFIFDSFQADLFGPWAGEGGAFTPVASPAYAPGGGGDKFGQ